MDVLLGGPEVMGLEPVAWVLAVVAGVALLFSARAPGLGSRLGWVFPIVVTVASVAVLVVDATWLAGPF